MDHTALKLPLDRNQIRDLLKAHDVMPTRQRMAIAAVLFARPQHVSADQVLASVNESIRNVSKATVYNTLGLFAHKGLIREVIVDPQRVFYDPNIREHHHLYNNDTGELVDIEAGEILLGHLPSLPKGTKVAGIDVIIRLNNSR
ncbi:MAG: Fur family transcriptional regulator [Gammaproteobacteria bacterium]|nr:MAG: Fur family transcriptional regulator [Gammaproteobacteria bacterium]